MSSRHIAPSFANTIGSFLRSTLPFSEIDKEESYQRLTRSCVVDFQPLGTRLMGRDLPPLEHLLLVQKGGVKLYVVDEDDGERLLDYRGEGSSVGEMALLSEETPEMEAVTLEDTFFIRMPKAEFLWAMEAHVCVANYYLKKFSDTFTSKYLAEMRTRRTEFASGRSFYLFSTEIGTLATRAPLECDISESIQNSARTMVKHKVGSLLVRDESDDIVGILTDKDLRQAIALGIGTDAPVETIMSAPVVTIRPHEFCFDALLTMMTNGIHHLAVVDGKRITGVVTSHDILVMQGKSPMSIFSEIKAQTTIEGLYPLNGKIPSVVRTLLDEGAKAGHITRMISVLNDLILERILQLLEQQLGKPPAPYAFLLLGSEGRREQTFATDQDNALIFDDFGDDIVARAADMYFDLFAQQAIRHLVKCGFPPCRGGIMASNPKWRMPVMGWKKCFKAWIEVPEPRDVLHATIFFDLRTGPGHRPLVEDLKGHVLSLAPRSEVFLHHLAVDCLASRPPLTLFRNFIVEKSGEHKNLLDIKRRGLMPFVDFSRVLSLRHAVWESSTLGRLKILAKEEHIPRALYNDAAEAFELLLQLRLVHQLNLIEQGETPNNFIDPSRLSELEKQTLKNAFEVIGRMQSFLKEMFRLNM